MLALRLGYLTENEGSVALGLITENSKMLTALRNRLKEREMEIPCNLSPVPCNLTGAWAWYCPRGS